MNEKATIRNRRRRQRKRGLLKLLKDENASLKNNWRRQKVLYERKEKERQQLMEREIIQMRVAQQMLLLQQQNILNRQSNIIAQQQPTSFQPQQLAQLNGILPGNVFPPSNNTLFFRQPSWPFLFN